MKLFRKACAAALAALCMTVPFALGETLFLPENLTRIDAEAFYQTVSADEVVLPEGVTSIGSRAFAESRISKINLPSSLTYIAEDAFANCKNLTAMVQEGSYAHGWCMENGVRFELVVESQNFETKVLEDGTLAITGYTGTAVMITIPGRIGDVSVSAIAPEAFKDNAVVAAVALPASLMEIGDEAFAGCGNLQRVTVAEDSWLSVVGNGAFRGCARLSEFPFVETLGTIGEEAFCASGLIRADLTHVTALGREAFSGCRMLEEVILPAVEMIPERCFYECPIETVKLTDGLEVIREGAFYGTDLTEIVIPGSVTYIGKEAFNSCASLQTAVLSEGVTTIGYGAFGNCAALRRVELPESLSEMSSGVFDDRASVVCMVQQGSYAHEWCIENSVAFELVQKTLSFETAALDDGTLAVIGYVDDAEAVTIPATIGGRAVTVIAAEAFMENGKITSVRIPASVTTIENMAFSQCANLQTVTLAEGSALKRVDFRAFYGCAALKQFPFDEGLSVIGEEAFAGCGLTEVNLSHVSSLGERAFSGCAVLEKAVLPAIERIPYESFEGCAKLQNVTMPEGVKALSERVFADCGALERVVLPVSIESIAGNAFARSEKAVCVVGRNSFAHEWCAANGVAFVLEEDERLYETAELADGTLSITGYTGYAVKIEIPATIGGKAVTALGERLFYRHTELASVSLPASVRSIGNRAFYGCVNLKTVMLADGSALSSVGSGAFYGCAALAEFPFAGSLKTIGYEAFCGAGLKEADLSDVTALGNRAFRKSALERVTLPAIDEVPYGLFAECASLKTVNLPDGVETIGDEAFYACTALAQIDIPSTVTTIGGGAFKGCAGLSDPVSLKNVTSIGWEAFENCGLTGVTLSDKLARISLGAFKGSGLKAVVIPASVRVIDGEAFRGCAALTTVTMESGVETIGSNAFAGCGALKQAVLPESLTDINAEAFKGSSAVVCTVVENSYSHNWCREIGVGFALKE